MLEEKRNKINNKQEKDVIKKEERNRNHWTGTEKEDGNTNYRAESGPEGWTEQSLYVGVGLKENPRMSSFNDKNGSIQLSRFVLNNCWSGPGILSHPSNFIPFSQHNYSRPLIFYKPCKINTNLMRLSGRQLLSLPFSMKTVACLEQLIDMLYFVVQLSIYRIKEQ